MVGLLVGDRVAALGISLGLGDGAGVGNGLIGAAVPGVGGTSEGAGDGAGVGNGFSGFGLVVTGAGVGEIGSGVGEIGARVVIIVTGLGVAGIAGAGVGTGVAGADVGAFVMAVVGAFVMAPSLESFFPFPCPPAPPFFIAPPPFFSEENNGSASLSVVRRDIRCELNRPRIVLPRAADSSANNKKQTDENFISIS